MPTKARVMPDSSFMTFLMRRGALKTWSRVCVTPCLQARHCFRTLKQHIARRMARARRDYQILPAFLKVS